MVTTHPKGKSEKRHWTKEKKWPNRDMGTNYGRGITKQIGKLTLENE